MTSYTFGLGAPWWFLALCIVLALGLSLWVYRVTVPPISPVRKGILITLRTLALALLFLILFEPILNLVRVSEEPPRVAVLLDNSQSMRMTDASVDRKAEYDKVLRSLDLSVFGDNAQVFSFDESASYIHPFAPDSLQLAGQMTNISKAFATIFTDAERNNVRAVLLVSDGAFNAGENPLYNAELLGRPVFTLGIGDSTEPKDISVQSLITNEVAYVNTPIPVNITIKSSGFEQGELKVELKDNGTKVAEQTVNVRSGSQTYPFVFEYKPAQEGVRKLTAEVSSLTGELTTKNNSVSEFVKVLKNKRSIVLLAGAPSPDVSFLHTVLSEDPNISIEMFVQKKGAEFYDKLPTAQAIGNAEALVLVGFPVATTPATVIDLVKKAAEGGKPLFFIASQQVDYAKLKALEPYLPFTVTSSRPQELLVMADVRQQALAHPSMKITGGDSDVNAWNQLPPIFRTETFVRPKPEAEVLSTLRVNNAPLNEPLLLARSLQNKRSFAIMGYGLFRWKLLGYAAETAKGHSDAPDVFSTFFRNSLRWLTTQEQGKLVRIRTTKKMYANGEKVELVGQVYDASYSPVDNADVRVKITGSGEPRDVVLTSLGGGRYTASVEGLPSGDYAFAGTASIGNEPYGSDNGRFSIGDMNIEYFNPRMNAQLLRAISERTGGKFYTAATMASAIDDIKNARGFATRPITEKSEYLLWNFVWILGVAIVLFALEWFIRKRGGMV